MKKSLMVIFAGIFSLTLSAQSPTFKKDAASMEESIRNFSQKRGYSRVIKYDLTNLASVFILPNKDYGIFYVYDNTTGQAINFKASLVSDSDSLRTKYTLKPFEVSTQKSASVRLITFSTNKKMILDKDKLPVKIEADPKAIIYIYARPRGQK